MTKMLLFIALFLLAGCEKQPMSIESTENVDFKVEKLFTHDGCTVYRFYDYRNHYYTDCRGRTTSTYSTSCGKGCTSTHYDEVETND